MADRVSPVVRSRIMAAIRGKDTSPELAVRRYLHRCGLRYRLHAAGLLGKPDLSFPRYRTVVFVHGCFWHVHPGCRYGRIPNSNRAYWASKLRRNVLRDKRNVSQLKELGWHVETIWECQIGDRVLSRLACRIRSRANVRTLASSNRLV